VQRAIAQPASAQEQPEGRTRPVPGGIDTDAIRRSWPDILAKIFTIRRTTWTFLSEHTQVLDYDGRRLLLGIQTDGLAATFRRGQHAELVRQALSEVLGVEAVVEGIPTAQGTRPASPTADAHAPGAPPPAASHPPAASVPAESRTAESRTAESRTAEPPPADSAGSLPAGALPAAPAPGVARGIPSTPMQRARAAVAQEVSSRRASASSSGADDSMVSADDENIEDAVAVGQPVIARVLGGTVIDPDH